MKQLLLILLSAIALSGCGPTVENPPQEKPPRPENALSTLTEEGFDDRSWYMRLNSSGKVGDKAPIAGGSVTITANADGTHTAIFALQDDAFNNITGSYTGTFLVEDFR